MIDDSLLVRDVMTKDVVTLERNDRLLVADDLMRLGRIRHLPVVDEAGALAGIVTQRDLFHNGIEKALGHGYTQRSAPDMVVVREAMKADVATTTPDTPLRDAARRMREREIGCLVVVDDGRIAGILTETDFVKLLARSK